VSELHLIRLCISGSDSSSRYQTHKHSVDLSLRYKCGKKNFS